MTDQTKPACCVDADGECPQHAVLRRMRERAATRARAINPASRMGTSLASQRGLDRGRA